MQHLSSQHMSGRTVVVTGGTSGIGMETARGLASMGAHVSIIGRSRERTERVARELDTAVSGSVDGYIADMSSQVEVRRVADELRESLPRLDVLVNNVGGYWSTRHVTDDGHERTLAVNHLAPFLLTHLLLDRLEASDAGRVVTVSSRAESMGRIDFDDLEGERNYSGARAYNQSKLANLMFTYELARRLEGTTVTANALHPGMVSTSFGADDPGRVQRLMVPLLRPFMKSPVRGAATSIRVASDPGLAGVTGQYFVNGASRRSSGRSHDRVAAARLWQVSRALVGLESPA